MEGIPLPIFGGELSESWEMHEIRLCSWLRTRGLAESEDNARIDYLLLSLRPNSGPLNWFIAQPNQLKSNFFHCLNLLKNKYGSDLRREMLRLSALNSLEVRTFRDTDHKSEMVAHLVNDLEHLLAITSTNQDSARRECLLRCFRGFTGALKMMNRATSYDGAVLAALTWESSVISKAQGAIEKAQKNQTSRARPKSQSQPPSERPTEQSSKPTHALHTQDFRPNTQPINLHPDAYFKTHPLPDLRKKPSQIDDQVLLPIIPPKHTIDHSQFEIIQPSYDHVVFKEDSEPDPMMESLVDPHFAPGPSSSRPPQDEQQFFNQQFIINTNPEEEILKNDPVKVPQQNPGLRPSSHYKIKPLVYDPKKNPYPPPEQLAENQPENESNKQFAAPQTSSSLPPLQESAPAPNANRNTPEQNPWISNWIIQQPNQSTHAQSLPNQPGTMPGGLGAEVPSPTPEFPTPKVSKSANYSSDILYQVPWGGPSESAPEMKRRPSKLIKLRRKESNSSNNSSTGRKSSESIRRIKSFIGSLQRRSLSRDRQSESDSIHDREPHTPSTIDRSGTGSGLEESVGNEKMRPMQVQFHRLFRKHQQSDNNRRQNRSMLVNKTLPQNEQPIKGQSKTLRFGKNKGKNFESINKS